MQTIQQILNQLVVKWIKDLILSARLGFDSWLGQTKNYKNWYSQLPCLTYSIIRDKVKHPMYVADRWAIGSLT